VGSITLRVTANGTLVAEHEPVVLDGFRAHSTVRSGGPSIDRETVRLTTLDGKRVVGLWTGYGDGRIATLRCHYRDRGDDVLGPLELDEFVAACRATWPRR
jgi:hypothetical protein